ncbi:jg4181 [Pararge aegeria aegeria]|uniref:Jg4181 protein n=1 Tax=Pararge aegeria aegeria TaxID=348720 RepID=A0A8S4SC34_9NEOP|nr:jg4181 [Pararge aegeria aegeria]
MNKQLCTICNHSYSTDPATITFSASCLERPQTNGDDSLLDEPSKNFELSFEYLLSKDNLVWVTLRTEHAIFISVCLQSIVDELMRQKNGEGPTSPRCKRASLAYLRRDGSTHLITPSSSSDTLSSVVLRSFEPTTLENVLTTVNVVFVINTQTRLAYFRPVYGAEYTQRARRLMRLARGRPYSPRVT